MKKNIAIFASGGGSNAQAILDYFKNNDQITVALIGSNVASAGVLDRAKKEQIPTFVFTKSELNDPAIILPILQKEKIELLVLAGFLWLIPAFLVKSFPEKIINIHPALLPKYGGKGMHGSHVHEAVFQNQEAETGITIHFVNENYDEGKYILQEKVTLEKSDNPIRIAQKVLELEHFYLPRVIEKLLT